MLRGSVQSVVVGLVNYIFLFKYRVSSGEMARAESPYRKLVVVETYETGRFFGREVQEARNDAHDNGVLEDDFDKWEAEFNSICAAEWEKRVKSAALT